MTTDSTVHASNNSLKDASSAYLRSAMHQPVQWHEWSEEAFAKAAREDKPILLDIGAVWCHWCHVMDRESYEDPKLAAVVNEHFVAIKVDRDERPDVDSRYQAAVQSMSGQGGWPLTAVLTPDGKPYFGGTYFPPEERYGRPSFERVLRTMAEVWKKQRTEVTDTAGSVMAAIEHGETFAGRSGQLSATLVDKLVSHAVGQFDAQHGGFGSQPKFPHPSALDLLIDVVGRTGDEAAKKTVVVTLEKMALGGIYDQLAGGFHRYSVDERWVVPHFEKMLYDNAGLLKNYAHAYQTFVNPEFARVAKDIIRWMDEWLTDRERGGFYASQDADVTLDDDGDYFTWTREEAAAVLTPEELSVVELHYHIGHVGDMHHNPQKNVLHVNFTLDDTARRLKLPVPEVQARIASASKKLYAARLERSAPFLDKTIYTSWNAMAVSAYLQAGRVLHLGSTVAFALKTLDRILAEAWNEESGLAHVISYAGSDKPKERICGVLDDYAFTVEACLDGWEATGEIKYYKAAEQIGDAMVARFYDLVGGGFFDAELPTEGKVLGALSARRKPLQDTPTPAGNPSAVIALLRLEHLNGRQDLRERAEDTLENFAGIVEHFGLYAGSYGLALQQYLQAPTQVVVIGEGDEARRLKATALAGYAVNKSVIRLGAEQISPLSLPPMLAETLPALPGIEDGVMAVVCRGNACLPPVHDANALLAAMAG
ncbi:Thymidylate kinase [Acidisarcina polymorpha]|uniref:Thymidylate kinase n=1 Tax=Acidisarcina polymorpha TaxID=2211140 RepID=A0A2Z5G8D9_9BACT|nr:thioredoxin domain-containing protein [Acidisarcina polymorpha]AXC15249.1 Thymidylate kinase [Acidisarcina polymorpha]